MGRVSHSTADWGRVISSPSGVWDRTPAAKDFGAFHVQFYVTFQSQSIMKAALKWEIPILYLLVGLSERCKLPSAGKSAY